MESIPEIPADLLTPEGKKEQDALLKLNAKEADRIAQKMAIDASMKTLASNSDFRAFVKDYLGGDVEFKLDQLRTCPVADLAIARQRWIDAEKMHHDLMQVIDPHNAG